MSNFTAERYHDFSYGHRVVGHETKCRHLHGHNGRVHFTCQAVPGAEALDNVGRVIDFTEIKNRLCMWLENNWDHKFLAWKEDKVIGGLIDLLDNDSCSQHGFVVKAEDDLMFRESLVLLPFNPTAENLAKYLVDVIGPQQLAGTGIELLCCRIEETAKCSATYVKGY